MQIFDFSNSEVLTFLQNISESFLAAMSSSFLFSMYNGPNTPWSVSAQTTVFPLFPTVAMPDHHYTNGGALAFQGASIKEGKKSCSRRGEIHFVPSSNICCSRRSQKDARIKPKSPLIYCNDRQTDRQAERMTICGREGEKGKDKNNFCLPVCQFLLLSACMCRWWGRGGSGSWERQVARLSSAGKNPLCHKSGK